MTTSRWSEVASSLRGEIGRGEYGPGGAIDTEGELCRRFATSRITVRRALVELKREGLVQSQRGSGWRTTTKTSPTRLTIAVARSTAEEPIVLVRSNTSWRTTRPSTELVAVLNRAGVAVSRKHGEPPWDHLSYLTRAAGTPCDLVDVWFAPHIRALEIDRKQLATVDTAALFASHGVRFGTPIQTARAALPAPHQAEMLECPADALLVIERVMVDEVRDVVFVAIHRHPASRVTLSIDLPTTDHPEQGRITLQSNGLAFDSR